MPARGCQIIEIDMGSRNEFGFHYVCNGEKLGEIKVAKIKVAGKVRWIVRRVHVLESHRRRGVATDLYEAAASEACRRRAPLASNERMDVMSPGFWEKQIRKGRARVLSRKGGREGSRRAPVYELTCPPPPSLRGLRGRRARRRR